MLVVMLKLLLTVVAAAGDKGCIQKNLKKRGRPNGRGSGGGGGRGVRGSIILKSDRFLDFLN